MVTNHSTQLVDTDLVFSNTVRPQVGRLFSVAYTILRNRHEAEDAVQETMVLAWKSWSKLRDQENPGPWLAKICVNHCLRQRKKLQRTWGDVEIGAPGVDEQTAVPFQGRMMDWIWLTKNCHCNNEP